MDYVPVIHARTKVGTEANQLESRYPTRSTGVTGFQKSGSRQQPITTTTNTYFLQASARSSVVSARQSLYFSKSKSLAKADKGGGGCKHSEVMGAASCFGQQIQHAELPDVQAVGRGREGGREGASTFSPETHHSCRYSKCEEPGTLALNTMRQLKLPAPFLHLTTPRAHGIVIIHTPRPPCLCSVFCAHHESTLRREKGDTGPKLRPTTSVPSSAVPPQRPDMLARH